MEKQEVLDKEPHRVTTFPKIYFSRGSSENQSQYFLSYNPVSDAICALLMHLFVEIRKIPIKIRKTVLFLKHSELCM